MAWKESQYSRDTISRFARAEVWMRVVVQKDACPACLVHKDRIYTPDQSPRLPIPDCVSAYCRCRFEAVDPISKLPVSELVRRGAQLVKAGQRRGAVMALRRAVTLDELYEPGWLWLSAVVDEVEKVHCLEKVLTINPQNTWARKNLRVLRRKMGTDRSPTDGALSVVDVPLDVLQMRAERQVIVEQWQAFMDVIVEAAPKIAYEQAMAFLHSLEHTNERAIDMLFTIPALRDEVEHHWRELDTVGQGLGRAMRNFPSRTEHYANAQAIHEMFQTLFEELVARREIMRKQLAVFGGRPE